MNGNIYSYHFRLTAAEVGPQLEMPLSSLVVAIIDTATAHANAIGIGFDALSLHNASWVLSRLSVELDETPRVNGSYRLDTWVESVGRLSSDRGFALFDEAEGRCIGRVHTVWMAIDMTTRRPVDLQAVLGDFSNRIVKPEYPSQCPRIAPFQDEDTGYDYTFKVSDIDVNCHVTTRRYIDLIIDLLPLSVYDSKRIARFGIAFKHEARYSETARISLRGADARISTGDTLCALATLGLADRTQQ